MLHGDINKTIARLSFKNNLSISVFDMLLFLVLNAVLIQTGLCFGYLGSDAIRAQTG